MRTQTGRPRSRRPRAGGRLRLGPYFFYSALLPLSRYPNPCFQVLTVTDISQLVSVLHQRLASTKVGIALRVLAILRPEYGVPGLTVASSDNAKRSLKIAYIQEEGLEPLPAQTNPNAANKTNPRRPTTPNPPPKQSQRASHPKPAAKNKANAPATPNPLLKRSQRASRQNKANAPAAKTKPGRQPPQPRCQK